MAKLFNADDVTRYLEQFENTSKRNIAETCGDVTLEKFMKEGNDTLVRQCIFKIQSNLIAAIPNELPVPGVSMYITPMRTSSGVIDVISLSITNKFRAAKTFKFKKTITTRTASLEGATDVMLGIYKDLITNVMAEQNLSVLNEVYANAAQDAGLPYGIRVTSALGIKDRKVETLSNEEVVFVADYDRVFNFNDLMILAEPIENLITEEAIQSAYDNLVAELTSCQLPQQLVAAHGGATLRYVCNINKQVRPMTLIKKVCTKAVDKIIGNKETLAYWTDGESYALVVRREDGNFDIVLDPFNIETMLRSDVDVLAALGQESEVVMSDVTVGDTEKAEDAPEEVEKSETAETAEASKDTPVEE